MSDDDTIAVIRVVEDGDAITAVVGVAVGERVTQHIVHGLDESALDALMYDIGSAIDDDLVEPTVAAWCAMQGG